MKKNKSEIMKRLEYAKKILDKLEKERSIENQKRAAASNGKVYQLVDVRTLNNFKEFDKAESIFFSSITNLGVGKFWGNLYQDRMFMVCEVPFKMMKTERLNDVINYLVLKSNMKDYPTTIPRTRFLYESLFY